MPMTCQRQPTPGASLALAVSPVLVPSQSKTNTSAKKRGLPDGDIWVDRNTTKKAKTEVASIKDKDKKKRKKRKRRVSIVSLREEPTRASASTAPAKTPSPSPSTRLTPQEDEQLDSAAEEAVSSLCDTSSDKAKGKGKDELEQQALLQIEDHTAQIALLKQELAERSSQLQKYQTQITQIHHALTCQICLDLLYKPYALAPCGHITCYECLVRWFTNDQDVPANGDLGNGSFIFKKKTCPTCRTLIMERPVEVWSIKSMVANIAKSGLIELPALAPSPASENANVNADPWHKIFRAYCPQWAPNHWAPITVNVDDNNGEGGRMLEDWGMYDAEDGGVYRCIDCMHEIWGQVCTNCQRVYPGHESEEEDEDEESVYHVFQRYGGGLLAELGNIAGGWLGGGDVMSDEVIEPDFRDEDEEAGQEEMTVDGRSYPGQFPIAARHSPQIIEEGGENDGNSDDGEYRVDFTDEEDAAEVTDGEYAAEFTDEEREDDQYEGSFIDDGPEVIELDDPSLMRRYEGTVMSDDDEDVVRRAARVGRRFRLVEWSSSSEME